MVPCCELIFCEENRLKIIKKIYTSIKTVILIAWLIIWFIPLIISDVMIDILLRYLGVSNELLLLNRFSKLLGEIGEHLKTKNNNQENVINE